MSTILQAAILAIELINEQIAAGRDINNKPYKYGTRPFARPLGGLRGVNIKSAVKSGKIKPFSTKNGARWGVITGGYASLREMRGLSTSGDFLQDTGRLLRDLTAKQTSGIEARIGFSSTRSAEIAYYLNKSGAGKSRRLWQFLGLTPENRQKLADELGVLIAENIRKSGRLELL